MNPSQPSAGPAGPSQPPSPSPASHEATSPAEPSPLEPPVSTQPKGLCFKACRSGLLSVWRFFTRMELAIVLLVSLALSCLVGVVLPQEHLVDPFEIKARFGPAYPWMKALGLFNVFSSLWFLTLEGLFFFSVLFGSFIWLRPTWSDVFDTACLSAATLKQRYPKTLQGFQPSRAQQPLLQVQAYLKQQGYQVFQSSGRFAKEEAPQQLYARQGTWSRLGPMLAHVGILTMLLAALGGTFTSFMAQKVALPQQPFALSEAETFTTSVPLSWWLGHLPRWHVTLKQFEIDYYPHQPSTAQQYTSTLNITDPETGQLLASGQTSVNAPFRYEGVDFYQASFAPTGEFELEINGKPVQAEVSGQFEGRAYGVLPLSELGGSKLGANTSVQAGDELLFFPFFRQQDGVPENHLQLFVRHQGQLQGLEQPAEDRRQFYLAEGGKTELLGLKLAYRQPVIASGLQIRATPEAPWMLLAFFFLTAGVLISLKPQRQLWLAMEGHTLWLASKERKAAEAVAADVQGLKQRLSEAL